VERHDTALFDEVIEMYGGMCTLLGYYKRVIGRRNSIINDQLVCRDAGQKAYRRVNRVSQTL